MTGSDLSFIKGMHTDYIKWWGKAEKKRMLLRYAHSPDTTGFYLLKDKQYCAKK